MFIWLGLILSMMGLVFISFYGLFGSGDSVVMTWSYRLGLLFMFAGLSLSLFGDLAL